MEPDSEQRMSWLKHTKIQATGRYRSYKCGDVLAANPETHFTKLISDPLRRFTLAKEGRAHSGIDSGRDAAMEERMENTSECCRYCNKPLLLTKERNGVVPTDPF